MKGGSVLSLGKLNLRKTKQNKNLPLFSHLYITIKTTRICIASKLSHQRNPAGPAESEADSCTGQLSRVGSSRQGPGSRLLRLLPVLAY